MNKWFLLTLLICLTALSCGRSRFGRYEDVTWKLTTIESYRTDDQGNAKISTFENSVLLSTLGFYGDHIAGNSGCEPFAAGIGEAKDGLFYGLDRDPSACDDTIDPNKVMYADSVLAIIADADDISLKNGRLRISAGAQQLTYVAVDWAERDHALSNTEWQLSAITESGEETPVVASSGVTARFEDAAIRGVGGCNNYWLSYTVMGERIEIGREFMERHITGCDAGFESLEVRYLELMNSAETFQVTADQLTINAGKAQLQFKLQK